MMISDLGAGYTFLVYKTAAVKLPFQRANGDDRVCVMYSHTGRVCSDFNVNNTGQLTTQFEHVGWRA